MIKLIYYTLIAILCISMLTSCGQRGDFHNPLGLTGGSEGGYGKRQDRYYYDSAIPQNDNSLEGVWTETNETLTIHSDGTFKIKSGEEIHTGTYSKVNDKLTLNFKDGYSVTYSYTLEKESLFLREDR